MSKNPPSFRNRQLLEASEACACYSCLGRFDVAEIVQWVDDHQTAVCPRCGIDAVVPGQRYTDAELVELEKEWFGLMDHDNESSLER